MQFSVVATASVASRVKSSREKYLTVPTPHSLEALYYTHCLGLIINNIIKIYNTIIIIINNLLDC